MTKEQLIAAIRVLTDYKGVTLGEIEKALTMPKNCLSGMVNGSRNLSTKWHSLLEAYVEARLKGATEIVIPIGMAKERRGADKKTAVQPAKVPVEKKITPAKTPPAAMTKSQQIRWHRENNQTLQ